MARSFQARCSMGKVYFPHNTWSDRVINQCVGFPAGKYDDAVDVCALIGLALDETQPTFIPTPVVKKKPDRWNRAFEGWIISLSTGRFLELEGLKFTSARSEP